MIATGNHFDYMIRCALQHWRGDPRIVRKPMGIATVAVLPCNDTISYVGVVLSVSGSVALGVDA